MNYYPVYFITLATLSDSKLVLKVNGTPTIAEHSHFVLRFAPGVSVPEGVDANTPVVLEVNGTQYEMFDKFAEVLQASELPLTLNKQYFSTRYSLVGGIGSQTTSGETPTTTYYFVAWDLPIGKRVIVNA